MAKRWQRELIVTNTNKTRAAYRRTDMLKKRRPLMQDWDDFCDGFSAGDNVVPIRGARK